VTMLQFMPWKAPNRFYVESKGFPSMAMLKVCLVTKAVQTTVSVACQIAFLCAKSSLTDAATSAQAKALFILSISVSFTNVLLGMVLLCLKQELLKTIQEDDSRRDNLALAAVSSQTGGRSDGGGDMEAPARRRDSEDMHLGEIYSQGEDGDDVIAGSNPMTDNPLHTTPISVVVEPGRDDNSSSGGGIDVEEERQRERSAWARETECLREEFQRERDDWQREREDWQRERHELQRRYDQVAGSMPGGPSAATESSPVPKEREEAEAEAEAEAEEEEETAGVDEESRRTASLN
jgi:hypothetical protein